MGATDPLDAAGDHGEGTDQAAVARVYDRYAAAEYERLDRSLLQRAELALTADLLDEYAAPGARVLDVGAGPGRYAELLLGRGCRVGLTDLSASSLRLFEERIDPPLAEGVLFCRQGSATDLGWLAPESFDVVLLMGPLYHLVSHGERQAALRGAWRALRPDGVLVAAFLSPYRNLVEAVTAGDGREVERLHSGGATAHLGMQQHRTWPRQASEELVEAGFDVLRTRNLEGLASLLDLDARDVEAFLTMLRATCELPDLLGATLHFVCVARRPTQA